MNERCRVAIIDDEDWIREGLREHVEWDRLGCALQGAFQDGDEALRFLRQNPVDVLLSDIRMPSMSGLELLRRLRQDADSPTFLSRTKVIFLSGYGDFSYAQEALRLGASDYLLKPADIEEIEQAVIKARDSWLAEREQEQKLAKLHQYLHHLPKTAYRSEPNSHVVKKALSLMFERYAEDLQISQIADEVFVTPNYLSRLFRQDTGLAFSDHLSHIRLQKACELLVTSSLKIYQVGEAVGYPNSRYFSEWFQKQMGVAPGEYRNRYVR